MRYLSDQQWILESPELLALDEGVSAQSLLQTLEANSDFHFQTTHRLGVYFEQLWYHLVQSSDKLELLHHNLQVIINKHTYGEFDSIIFDGEQQIHCELAVKFYLQIGKGNSLSHWVGPNLKDRFDDKYKRIFEHQLQLSEQPQIKSWLEEKQVNIQQKKLLTRGRLFYPWQQFIKRSFTFPDRVNPNHEKGFWIDYQQLDTLLEQKEYDWYQLPRFYWFSQIQQGDEGLLPVERDFNGFSLQKIVALKDDKEVMRGFVVNQEWLHKAQQRVLE